MLSALLAAPNAFAGQGFAARPVAPVRATAPIMGGAETLTSYVTNLEQKVYDLSSEMNVRMPQRCEGDSCLSMEAYIDILEETASTLETQWQNRGGHSEWDPQSIPDTVSGSMTMIAYLARLEEKVVQLSAEAGVTPPQQCVGDECMTIDAYVEVLEDAAARLEAQWSRMGSSSEWGSVPENMTANLTMGAYLNKLEGRVNLLAGRLGVEPPRQCEGDECLTVDAYAELLEEVAVTLDAQWKSRGGHSEW